jgi:hypothetical protein
MGARRRPGGDGLNLNLPRRRRRHAADEDLAALIRTWGGVYQFRRDRGWLTAVRPGAFPLTKRTVRQLTAAILADQAGSRLADQAGSR